MKSANKILENMTDMLVRMSEGNPEAITVLTQMLMDHHCNFIYISQMDEMNMRGPSIWIGYKDYCKEDIKVFIEAVKQNNKDMIDTINKELGSNVVVEHAFNDDDLPPDLRTLNHLW